MSGAPAFSRRKIQLAEPIPSEPKVHELDKHIPPKHEIEIYIDALKELQREGIVAGQEDVRKEAIRVLHTVFSQWGRRCTCPRSRRTHKKAVQSKPNGKVSGRLCQACKRLSTAWRVLVSLEKLTLARAQQGARIIENYQKRALPQDQEHEAVGVFRAFHQSRVSDAVPVLGGGLDDHDQDDIADSE